MQTTYYLPAGVTQLALHDGNVLFASGGTVSADSAYAPELEAAGCTATARKLSPQSTTTDAWSAARDGLAGVSVPSGGNCTLSLDTLNGQPVIKVVGTVLGGTMKVDLQLANALAFYGQFGTDLTIDRDATGSIIAYACPVNGAFATCVQAGMSTPGPSTSNPLTYNTVQDYHILYSGLGAVADPAWNPGWTNWTPTYPAEIAGLRLQFGGVAGKYGVAYLRRVFTMPQRKSRVILSFDDGYASAYALLKPVLDRYNLKATWAIIASTVGSPNFMALSDLQRLYAQGHELVPHGPRTNVTGNLIANYSNAADALKDVLYHRDWLSANGLLKPGAEKVYVWPQGQHQWATDDHSLRDALRGAGFVIGRTASPMTFNFIADLWPDKLVLPIIGHTQKTDATAEAANIAALIAAINTAATRGTDVILMLHRGVPSTDTNWGGQSGVQMRTTDLDAICAAIAANIAAGTQESRLLSDLA